MNKRITKEMRRLIDNIEKEFKNKIYISYNDYAKELHINDYLVFEGTPLKTLDFLTGFYSSLAFYKFVNR